MPDPRPPPDADAPATTPLSAVGDGPAFREGNEICGYRLLHKLGEGGMGVVFAAADRRTGRTVALKVMRRGVCGDPNNRERFLREARGLATLEHDHVVRLYQVDEADGQPFYVMELLAGESVRDRLKRDGRLPVADAVRVARDAARGLAAAHARGLVHRDVTPGNVWVEPSGRAKLLDFGLARAADPGADPLTRTGAVMGTPGFLAPEQAAGEHTDSRSDLFGLGCVLYLMATGAKPFPGTGQSPGADLDAVRAHEPPPPRSVNPDVPEPLDRLIRELLAKAPADRPASAAAVADRLTALLDGRPAGGGLPATVTHDDRTRDRKRVALSVRAGCVSVSVVVGCFMMVSIPLLTLGKKTSRTFNSGTSNGKPTAGPPAVIDTAANDLLLRGSVGLVVCGYRETDDRGAVREFAMGTGAAFAVTGDGVLLTNKHVVGEFVALRDAAAERERIRKEYKIDVAPALWVVFGERKYAAELRHVSDGYDLAVLKADLTFDRVFALRREAAVPKGRMVFALGYPESRTEPVSAAEVLKSVVVRKDLSRQGLPGAAPEFARTAGFVGQMFNLDGQAWVRHDAVLHAGNSGGPLIGEDGVVVGINTLKRATAGEGPLALAVGQLEAELAPHAPGLVWR